jgi:hypothetical protein
MNETGEQKQRPFDGLVGGHSGDGWTVYWIGSNRTRIGFAAKAPKYYPPLSVVSNTRVLHVRAWRFIFNRKTELGVSLTANTIVCGSRDSLVGGTMEDGK